MQKNIRDCGNMMMDSKYDMNTYEGMEVKQTMNYGMPMCGESLPGVVCSPIYECPQEHVCHRYICHEVPHVCPCNTRIINHHIYRHTYSPCYTCCEENEFTNVYDKGCSM